MPSSSSVSSPPPAPRRILSLWLPCLATDLLRRRVTGRETGRETGRPLVAVVQERGRLTLAACDRLAQGAGLSPGMPLADARAVEPSLLVMDADPAGDAAALGRLSDWCQRYSPWTALDGAGQVQHGAGGLWLDVTGCAHLFGGEAGLMEDLAARLERAGLEGRAAIADTNGAAWAVARFGGPEPWPLIVPPGGQAAVLGPLPVAALRLPALTVTALRRVGLHRIGDLTGRPRAVLTNRYGPLVAQRLDQALGTVEEPINPRRAVPPHIARMAFAEPISTAPDIHLAARRLLDQVCRGLAAGGQGARRLVLAAWRVDAGIEAPPQEVEIGTSRAARDPAHLFRLLEQKLDRFEPGPGFEVMALSVPAADPFTAEQGELRGAVSHPDRPPLQSPATRGPPTPVRAEGGGAVPVLSLVAPGAAGEEVVAGGLPGRRPPPSLSLVRAEGDAGARPAPPLREGARPMRRSPDSRQEEPPVPELVDRLGSRLGLAHILQPLPRESWWPERAVRMRAADAVQAAGTARPWPADRPRPVRLLCRPERVEVMAPVPDDPPVLFRWRGTPYRVRQADGPERLAPEWWRALDLPEPDGDPRDYYRVESTDGRRFWLYRLGLYRAEAAVPWYLHGFLG